MLWLALAGAIPAVIVAALAIPVHLDVSIAFADRLRGTARVRWLFGLVNVVLRRRSQAPPASAERTPAAAHDVDGRTPVPRGRKIIAFLETRGLLPRVVRLAGDLFRKVRVERLVARARYGLVDPADTGRLCGVLAPVMVLASASGIDVRCAPDFDRSILAGHCDGAISVRPLAVVAVAIAFACSMPVWRAIRAWRHAS